MATKTPYCNEELPTLRFPWVLKVSNFSELLLVNGHADVKHDNSTANFPGDLIGQTKYVLKQITKSVSRRLELLSRVDGGQVLQSHIPLRGPAQRLPTPRLVNRPT